MRATSMLRHGLLAMALLLVCLSGHAMAQAGKLDLDLTTVEYSELTALFPKGGDRKLKAYYDKIFEAQMHGYADAALDLLTEVIKRYPKTTWAYNNRGLVWAMKNDHDLAIADYSAAIGVDPKFTLPYVNRGAAWAKKGDLDRAIADFSESIRVDPKGSTAAYINRGLALRNKGGDFDRAMADLNQAILIDRTFSSAYVVRALLWRDKGNLERALTDLDEALRADKDDFEALNNQAIVWAELGDPRKAMEGIDKALEHAYSRVPAALAVRAQIWLRMGDKDKALADYKEALRQNEKFTYDLRLKGLAEKIHSLGDKP